MKVIRIWILLLSALACVNQHVQDAHKSKLEHPPETETSIYSLNNSMIDTIFKLDITGDGQMEKYVIAHDSILVFNYLLNMEDSILYSTSYERFTYDYLWFDNLDDDKELELIRAQGYSDVIDYFICDDVLSTNRNILYFTPLIKLDGYQDFFWGYPWLIDTLIRFEDQILVSYEYVFRDDDFMMSSSQTKLPNLFFTAKDTVYTEIKHHLKSKPHFSELSAIREVVMSDKKG